MLLIFIYFYLIKNYNYFNNNLNNNKLNCINLNELNNYNKKNKYNFSDDLIITKLSDKNYIEQMDGYDYRFRLNNDKLIEIKEINEIKEKMKLINKTFIIKKYLDILNNTKYNDKEKLKIVHKYINKIILMDNIKKGLKF